MVFDSVILDVAIGIVFVYLLLSLICSTVSELFARVLAWRSNTLAKGIQNLLNDPNATGLAKQFYQHPLIDSLDRDGKIDKLLNRYSKPSYIPSRIFAIVLLDIIEQDSNNTKPKRFEEFRNTVVNNKLYLFNWNDIPGNDEGRLKEFLIQEFGVSWVKIAKIEKIEYGTDGETIKVSGEKNYLSLKLNDEKTEVTLEIDDGRADKLITKRENGNLNIYSKLIDDRTKKALLVLFDNSQGRLDDLQKNIEDWFNDAMDRVSGWYKRNVQSLILLLALIITVGANIDTIVIANNLAQDSTLRSSVVASAEVFANKTASSGLNESSNVKELRNEIQQIQILPIGWSQGLPTDFRGWLIKIFGLFITIIAISLGAPIWFDMLNKLVDLRGTGKQP